jgi:hypothetical protein
MAAAEEDDEGEEVRVLVRSVEAAGLPVHVPKPN